MIDRRRVPRACVSRQADVNPTPPVPGRKTCPDRSDHLFTQKRDIIATDMLLPQPHLKKTHIPPRPQSSAHAPVRDSCHHDSADNGPHVPECCSGIRLLNGAPGVLSVDFESSVASQ